MALFVTGSVNPSLRSSQKTVEKLESISNVDIGLSQPYAKITRIDPSTREQIGPPLNAFFQKPPEFGATMAGRALAAERPPVSISEIVVSTEQNYGLFIQERVEMKLTVHRPSSLFDDEDSAWRSLITPGESHLLEYGWVGSSNNDLINGNGFVDEGGETRTVIPSRKKLLFQTYVYTIDIQEDGQVEILVKGWQSGDYMLRKMLMADVVDMDTKPALVDNLRDSNDNEHLRKVLQQKISEIGGRATSDKRALVKRVRLLDVANALIAPVVSARAAAWGYTDVELLLGNFNKRVGSLTKKHGGSSMSDKSIGDFEIPYDDLVDMVRRITVDGRQLTMKDFMDSLFSMCNSGNAWDIGSSVRGDSSSVAVIPTVVVKIAERTTKKGNVLTILAFDMRGEVAEFSQVDDLLKTEEQSRDRIKRMITERGIPFMTFGKGLAYIQEASFEVEMDQQIQRSKIEAAVSISQTREQVTSRTRKDIATGVPDHFHEIWANAIKGNVTMLGNFAFDTFRYAWVDFHVRVWDGFFNVRGRQDVLTAGSFKTTLELYSEGLDPFNTRRRLSQAEIKRRKEIEAATRDLGQARTPKERNRAAARLKAAQEKP